MEKYDFHTHTIYSDGDLSIAENVERAYKLGLSGIAITDHDNIDGWKEIDSSNYPISVFKGVELSTFYKNESVHLLGYYLNDGGDYSELANFLIRIRQERMKRLDKIIFLLKKYDILITREDVLKEADGAVARPHIIKAIMKKYPERCYSKDYLFDKYIGNDAPCFVPVNNLHTEDAIKLLQRNHCLTVLAHPLYIKKIDYKELINLGIDGIETFYNYNSNTDDAVLQFAVDNHLIITGGSDYHGPTTRDSIGSVLVDYNDAKTFLKKINYRK